MSLNFLEEGKGPHKPFLFVCFSNIKVTILVWKGLFGGKDKPNIDENMHNNEKFVFF